MLRCGACRLLKAETEFARHSDRITGSQHACKACAEQARRQDRARNPGKYRERERRRWRENKVREQARFAKWYAKNREADAEKSREWGRRNKPMVQARHVRRYAKNGALLRARSAAWRTANRGRARAKSREWQRLNPERARFNVRVRNGVQRRAQPAWADTFAMREAYDLAALRTQATGIQWQVDHAVPLINKKVCGLHCEFNLRVITASENQRKQNLRWPDMP